VKHWHPRHPEWRGKGRDTRYPPGWWLWPLAFLSLFIWAGLYLLIEGFISG